MARILVVDDDEAVSETFGRMLRADGHDATSVASVAEGFERAVLEHPDAILLDMRMVGVGGLDFLRRLRASPSLTAVPVGIVTGDYFLKDDVLAELGALGAAVRYKPLWMADLNSVEASSSRPCSL